MTNDGTDDSITFNAPQTEGVALSTLRWISVSNAGTRPFLNGTQQLQVIVEPALGTAGTIIDFRSTNSPLPGSISGVPIYSVLAVSGPSVVSVNSQTPLLPGVFNGAETMELAQNGRTFGLDNDAGASLITLPAPSDTSGYTYKFVAITDGPMTFNAPGAFLLPWMSPLVAEPRSISQLARLAIASNSTASTVPESTRRRGQSMPP